MYRETVRHSESRACLGKVCALHYQVTLQCNLGNSKQQARRTCSSRATRCPRRHCGTRKRLLTFSLTKPRQNVEAGFKLYQKPFIYGDLHNVPNSFCKKNALQIATPWRKLQTALLQVVPVIIVGRDSSVGITTRYETGRSGDRIPEGGEIFRTRPYRSWGPPSLLYKGYRVFPGVKAAGASR